MYACDALLLLLRWLGYVIRESGLFDDEIRDKRVVTLSPRER